jgi:heme oxygenase
MNRLAGPAAASGGDTLRAAPVGELIPLRTATGQEIPSLRQELRATTQDVHDRLHRHVGFAAIQDGTVSLEDYRTLIVRLHGFYVPFEAAAAIEPDRSDWLADDLKALGVTRPSPGVAECGHIPCLDSAHLRLGAQYMAEGSALGGRDLARGLDRLLGTGVVDGRRFFTGRGAGTGEAWRGYLARLSAAAPDPSARPQIIRGAVKTFDAFEQWLNGWSTSLHE